MESPSKRLAEIYRDKVSLDKIPSERVERVPVTIWVPVPAKEKFDFGQRVTKKQLGKDLQAGFCDFMEEIFPALVEAEKKTKS